MKVFILLLLHVNALVAEDFDYTDLNYEMDITESYPLTSPEPKASKICTKMQFYCESCSNLVMCVDSDYGFMKQRITCPFGTTCLEDKCSHDQNPLCDGTADIPFQCHMTGIFPDPFDCRKYHICVLKSNKIVNDQMELLHYKHQCQNDGDTQYKFDPKSTYCKTKLDKGCEKWPVPLCNHEGQTEVLEENDSIFYVCDLISGHLYPHLYVCPHGEVFVAHLAKCRISNEPISEIEDPIIHGWGRYNRQ